MNCLRLLNSTKTSLYILHRISPKYSTHPLKFLEVQDKWREYDNVSRNWDLIYKAPMDGSIKWAASYLTLTTSLFTCAGVYYGLLANEVPNWNQPIVLGSSDVVIADNLQECFLYLGAFIVFHIVLKILISKYVLRMYKQGDNYIAVFRGHMYNTIKTHHFSLNEFKKLKSGLVSWGDVRFSLGSKHCILLDMYFKTPEYFNTLLNKKQNNKTNENYLLFNL